jgi:hypothetical protein
MTLSCNTNENNAYIQTLHKNLKSRAGEILTKVLKKSLDTSALRSTLTLDVDAPTYSGTDVISNLLFPSIF